MLLGFLIASAGCDVKPIGERFAGPTPRPDAAPRTGATTDAAESRFLAGADGVFRLDAYKGRPLMVAILGAGVYDMDRVVRDLNKICEDLSARGLEIVGLLTAMNPDEDAAQAAEALNAIFPIARADSAMLATLGGPRALPTYILVDPRGAVRKQLAGAVEPEEIRTHLLDLFAEAR